LALLVAFLFATGVMTLFAGQRGDAWVFAAHGVGGLALAGVLGWKLVGCGGAWRSPRAGTAAPRRERAPSRWSRRR
jgi:hypothetical protein